MSGASEKQFFILIKMVNDFHAAWLLHRLSCFLQVVRAFYDETTQVVIDALCDEKGKRL